MMQKKHTTQYRRWLTLLLAAVMLLSTAALTGCSQEPAGDDEGGNAEEVRDNVVIGLSSDMTTFNPLNSATKSDDSVICQIYDQLYFYDDERNEIPRLAESYDVSDDGLVYTFHLRKGVLFQNGEELKASDVVFTIEAARESSFASGYVDQIAEAVATDDYTVEMKLSGPYAPFFEQICYLYILNEKAVTEAGDDYEMNPVGTSSYQLVSYEPGNKVELTRYDDCWKGAADIKDVTFRILSDANTTDISLEAGDLDFAEISESFVATAKASEALQVGNVLEGSVTYAIMNTEKAPFDNKLVRQAINYAIDRDFIVEAATENLATPTSIMISPNMFGYPEDTVLYDYNPDKARELLEQSGLELPIDIGKLQCYDGYYKTIAEVMVEDLAEVGINAEVELMEKNAFLENAFAGNHGIGIMAFIYGGDADACASTYTTEGFFNMARWYSSDIDAKFDEARNLVDPAARAELYDQIFDTVQEEALYVPFLYRNLYYAWNSALTIDDLDQAGVLVCDMHWN